MKCPDCKVNLKRRRTTRGDKIVERVNICPSCNMHYDSVEVFKSNYENIFTAHEKKIDSLSDQYNQLGKKHNNLINALRIVSQAV